MLRLSKLSDYGTVIMAHVARDPGRFHTAAEIAAAVAVPPPTVSKLLKAFAREHLLVSRRGASGGYALALPASQISIARIIAAVEGPIGLTECSAAAGLCLQEGSCSIRGHWQLLNRVVRDALDRVALADFARQDARPVELRAMPAPRSRARPSANQGKPASWEIKPISTS